MPPNTQARDPAAMSLRASTESFRRSEPWEVVEAGIGVLEQTERVAEQAGPGVQALRLRKLQGSTQPLVQRRVRRGEVGAGDEWAWQGVSEVVDVPDPLLRIIAITDRPARHPQTRPRPVGGDRPAATVGEGGRDPAVERTGALIVRRHEGETPHPGTGEVREPRRDAVTLPYRNGLAIALGELDCPPPLHEREDLGVRIQGRRIVGLRGQPVVAVQA
ncbi:hypothetical protein GCM10011575_44980 [Microlunatus endophyticus]|uniref:Uncharacterized protein n=1 Tax=Microlunatus endophyticus TaxID=1716077 RepID=A0A917SGS0_9ACTN|nr:hypothetical protein GCM10011575_44980 [Microlunatus endophyticus]